MAASEPRMKRPPHVPAPVAPDFCEGARALPVRRVRGGHSAELQIGRAHV